MRPLVIHFLVGTIEPTGTYFRFHNLAVALSRLGHDITVFGLDPRVGGRPREEHQEGVRYRVVPSLGGQSYFGCWNHPGNALRRLWEGHGACDVAHLFQPFLSPALPWLLRTPARALRIWDWDDLWGEDGLLAGLGGRRSVRGRWERFWTDRLERWLPGRAAAVTVCSRALAERARRRSSCEVAVIGNGFWPRPAVSREEARRRVGLRIDAQYVGFMGRTDHDLSWCLDALARHRSRARLRLAVCGPPASALAGLDPGLRERVDHLGRISAEEARHFAAAIDLGLLPLGDNSFNRSRFPIKFAEYLAAGTPVLVSGVGECARLAPELRGALTAGRGRTEWLAAFDEAAEALASGRLPEVDRTALEARLSWATLGRDLADLYCRPKPRSS